MGLCGQRGEIVVGQIFVGERGQNTDSRQVPRTDFSKLSCSVSLGIDTSEGILTSKLR